MFPPKGESNKNAGGGLIPFHIIRITSTAKLLVSSTLNYLNQNMIIGHALRSNASVSSYPSGPTCTVFSRRRCMVATCVYSSQGFGSLLARLVSSNGFLRASLICRYHQYERGQGRVKGIDNGLCEGDDDGSVVLRKSPAVIPTIIIADLREITILRDSISLTIAVNLVGQLFLEYPFTASVAIDDALPILFESFETQALQRKQVTTETRGELGSVVALANSTCLCCRWTYLPFCMCGDSFSYQPDTLGTSITDSMDNRSSFNAGNYGNNPEASQTAPENAPNSMQFNQQLYQAPAGSPSPGSNLYQQIPHYDPPPYSAVNHARLRPQHGQYVPEPKVSPYSPLYLEIPDENQNTVYAPPGNILMPQTAQGAVQAQASRAEALKWDQRQMLLQTCPPGYMDHTEAYGPQPEEVALASPAMPSPPLLPSHPVEAVGPGTVAAAWPVAGWVGGGGSSGASPSSGAIVTRGSMKKIGEPSHPRLKKPSVIRQTGRIARPVPRVQQNENRRSPALHDLLTSLVVEMLDYMDSSRLSTKDSSSLAKSSTNSTETQANGQGGPSASGTGFGTGTSAMLTNNGNPTASATAPQQYILGCAGSSRGQDGKQERDTDGSTITLKMLLETPYSPRGRSTRNRELEEYQRMLAEDELQRRIDELRARDREKMKKGNNNSNNNNNGNSGDREA